MSWAQNLINLYDKHVKNGKNNLPPIFHIYKSLNKNDISVKIDEVGDFIGTEKMGKGKIIIPVNEDSLKRSGTSVFPHPLFDKIKYLSPIFAKKHKNSFEIYINQLENWCNCEHSHPKVKAVLKYLKKGILVTNLEKAGVDCGAKGFSDTFILFEVIDGKEKDLKDTSGCDNSKLWENTCVRDSFVNYYENILQKTDRKDLCYLTGKKEAVTESYPKISGNSKLISSNDGSNFTYRGRFVNPEEALSVGVYNCQKLHNALTWIIGRQAYRNDNLIIVAWENNLNDNLPSWQNNSYDIVGKLFEQKTENFSIGYRNAAKLNKALDGYGSNIDDTSKMTVMEFEAPSDGRLSLKYYSEMSTKKYIENIKKWHTQGCWKNTCKGKNAKRAEFEGMPAPDDIARYAYGNEREDGYIELKADSFKSSVISKLLPCIVEAKRLPYNIVFLLVKKASDPMAYEKDYNWEAVLSAACSLTKKYRYEKFKEVWNMALNEETCDRNYLYGRLLAVADKVEQYSQYLKGEDVRATNAKRYMNAFSHNPFKIWKVIEEKMEPYLQGLNSGSRGYYEKLLNEIHNKFNEKDYTSTKNLNGLYLLGYHSQMTVLNKKKEENKDGE